MKKTIITEEEKAEMEEMERLKKRAARQAAKRELAPTNYPSVECVVLPMGDGKISMGIHIPSLGEAHYEEDEKFTTQLPTAISLYERGYVNFEGAREALAAAKKARAGDDAAEAAAKALQDKILGEAGV